jgi:hypothetical protein
MRLAQFHAHGRGDPYAAAPYRQMPGKSITDRHLADEMQPVQGGVAHDQRAQFGVTVLPNAEPRHQCHAVQILSMRAGIGRRKVRGSAQLVQMPDADNEFPDPIILIGDLR